MFSRAHASRCSWASTVDGQRRSTSPPEHSLAPHALQPAAHTKVYSRYLLATCCKQQEHASTRACTQARAHTHIPLPCVSCAIARVTSTHKLIADLHAMHATNTSSSFTTPLTTTTTTTTSSSSSVRALMALPTRLSAVVTKTGAVAGARDLASDDALGVDPYTRVADDVRDASLSPEQDPLAMTVRCTR